ncbi:MAG: 50S ribosomal protein L24 [Patescibacteria group bacterium]
MKIKKGDKVQMLRGKDRGKTGKILEVDSKSRLLTVEGLNQIWKHVRAKRGGEKGQKIQFPSAVPFSTVALVCGKCGEATRVGFQITGKEKVRVCRKCGETLA